MAEINGRCKSSYCNLWSWGQTVDPTHIFRLAAPIAGTVPDSSLAALRYSSSIGCQLRTWRWQLFLDASCLQDTVKSRAAIGDGQAAAVPWRWCASCQQPRTNCGECLQIFKAEVKIHYERVKREVIRIVSQFVAAKDGEDSQNQILKFNRRQME